MGGDSPLDVRSHTDEEDPDPRLDDGAISLVLEVVEQSVDPQHARKLGDRVDSSEEKAEDCLLPPGLKDPPSEVSVALDSLGTSVERVEDVEHSVPQVLGRVFVGEKREFVERQGRELPGLEDERVEEREEDDRCKRRALLGRLGVDARKVEDGPVRVGAEERGQDRGDGEDLEWERPKSAPIN